MSEENKITREQYRKRKKRKRLRPWAFWTLTFIFIITITTSAISLIDWEKDNQKIDKLNEEIEELVELKPIEEEGELVNPPEDVKSDYWYFVEQPFYDIDFTPLQLKNDDTIAFIHMQNTNINYPIVQTTNNEYYLTHAFDKTYNNAGWVYMDYENLVNLNTKKI